MYAMNALVAHRGPDDEGYWYDRRSGVALASRRLAILDLSADGRQPMTNETGDIQLVYNGEIYNYLELRSELEAKGHQFRSHTDTEVIVHLYEEEGIDAIRRLNGIFAIALWDDRKRQLLLARDQLGVKPLYYAQLPDAILFASELKALMAFPEIPRELNPAAIQQHLSYIWCAAPHTMFKHIRKLQPGYRIVYSEGGLRRHESFYDVPYYGVYSEQPHDEHVREVRRLVAQAVKRQLISDVPVGAFLSGGLDSSSIVAMMRQASGGPVRCYTISLEEAGEPDENPNDLPYARLAAKHFGVELREIRIRPDILGFAEKMVYVLDEPQADPACINVSLICQQARADGYKVLLSGTGGDDFFAGYRRHVALFYERFWGWLPQFTRRLIAGAMPGLKVGGTLARRTQKYFLYADRPAEERLLRYFLWAADNTVLGLYSSEFREEVAGLDVLQPLRTSIQRIPMEHDRLQKMLYLEAKHFLPAHNLNYTDKMSMSHGIEVRVPFLDLDLVRYVAHLPAKEKLQGTNLKALLKEAMKPYLPREILTRGKTGFGAPIRRWIRQDLREMVRDVLSEESLKRRRLFDPRAVQQLITDNENLRIDASYMVFSLMCIEMWLRNFVDKPVSLTPQYEASTSVH